MKYFNFKRYKFSTITRRLSNLSYDFFDFLKFINLKKTYKYLEDKISYSILDFLKFINLKKTYKYLGDKIYKLTKIFKYLDPQKYNVLNTIKKIKISSNRFLFYHLLTSGKIKVCFQKT